MAQEQTCLQCGSPMPAGAPFGLCPACLLKSGLRSQVGLKTQSETAAEPPTAGELAPQFPGLEITEMLGHGGMGVVYKARQKKLERFVALKILSTRISRDPAFAERFVREAQALARLNHPHIVVVYDFGQVDGLYYFLMEFVDGLSLWRLLDNGKLSPAEALAIATQICDALQYAHTAGIIHRDIKPENILLDKNGRVKIADFGLAKLVGQKPTDFTLTEPGGVMGTPYYMAPEQKEHPAEVDHRADIYSLGVVFYQMLTGELPLGRFAPPSQKVQIDVRLDEVVLHALEKEPERRYQQAQQVKTDVETIVATPGVKPGRSHSPDPRRPRFMAALLAGISIILIGGLLAWFLIPRPTPRVGKPPPPGPPGPPPPKVITTTTGWLPHTWSDAPALALVNGNIYIGGCGHARARLAAFNIRRRKWEYFANPLPRHYAFLKCMAYGGGKLLIVGGSKPEPGSSGVKSRPVAGIFSPKDQSFHDLTSQLRRADPAPHASVDGVAFNGKRFLLGGAGGATLLLSYSPGVGFINRGRGVPYHFASNNVLAVGSTFLIDGAGPGPGGEPGTRPTLGLVTDSGQFTDLTDGLPAGSGVMDCSGYDGADCLIQVRNTVDARQMFELYNVSHRTFRQVGDLFPKSLSVQGISGAARRFLIGGSVGSGAYLAVYRPAAGSVKNLTAELPARARTVSAGLFDGTKVIVAGRTAQDRVYVEILGGRAVGGSLP